MKTGHMMNISKRISQLEAKAPNEKKFLIKFEGKEIAVSGLPEFLKPNYKSNEHIKKTFKT